MLVPNPFFPVGDIVNTIFTSDNRTLAHQAGTLRKVVDEYPHMSVSSRGELQIENVPQQLSVQHYFNHFANLFRDEPGH